MAQPFATGFDLDQSDEQILEDTREKVANAPELQPIAEWQETFAKQLGET